MYKVFLSSTSRDLADYREAVHRAIDGLTGFQLVKMEDFGARDANARDLCARLVCECDLFVGLMGHHYGSCPPDDTTSFTEIEYRTATAAGLPRLMFAAPDDFPIPAKLRESDASFERQQALRREVMNERVVTSFATPEQLASAVTAALSNWTKEQPRAADAGPERVDKPSYQLPARNRAFAGREKELAQLHDILTNNIDTENSATVAIIGMNGIGKTELALEYAHRHLAEYSLVSWLPAEEPSSLANSYRNIASLLGLNTEGRDEHSARRIRAELEGRAGWLLVFDNAIEPNAIDEYIPSTGKGRVLISTNYKHWDSVAATLSLGEMSEPDSVALLLGRGTYSDLEKDAAKALATELGHLPLALAWAGAFMSVHELSISAYRRHLEMARERVLAWRPKRARYTLAVADAFETALTAAVKQSRSARPLLQFLSFLAPDAFPRDVLSTCSRGLPKPLRETLNRDLAIGALAQYSLINATQDHLSVHRLVQAVTRDGMSKTQARQRLASVVELLNSAYSTGYRYYRFDLESHVALATSLIGSLALRTIDAAYLSAHYARDMERLRDVDAIRLYLQSIAILESLGDSDNKDIESWRFHLGNCLIRHKDWDQAEIQLKKCLDESTRFFGNSSENVAFTKSSLGRVAAGRSDYKEAIALFEQAIFILDSNEDFKKTWSSASEIAGIRQNLAKCIWKSGDVDLALSTFGKARGEYEKAFEANHPITAQLDMDIANLYVEEGDFDTAVGYYKKAYECIKGATGGKENPDLARKIGALLRRAGRLEQAAQWHLKAEGDHGFTGSEASNNSDEM